MEKIPINSIIKRSGILFFFVNDLHKDKPSRFTLLDEDLVIWWDKKDQQWRVFQDMCPHRLAPLSTGRIDEDGLLECPYHGWTFSGKGDCQSIPQQPEGENRHKSPRACVKSYPSAIAHDMLFVYAGKKRKCLFNSHAHNSTPHRKCRKMDYLKNL